METSFTVVIDEPVVAISQIWHGVPLDMLVPARFHLRRLSCSDTELCGAHQQRPCSRRPCMRTLLSCQNQLRKKLTTFSVALTVFGLHNGDGRVPFLYV